MNKKIIFFSILFFNFVIFGQLTEFGKNKVNYNVNNWRIIKTDHFDIYFYQGGKELGKFTAMVAESSITKMEEEFNYKIKNRVPIIVYKSHKDFEETNITSEILEEFVGGFTEALKNRVVVPFEGSYADFRHVINHELTHALQFDMLYGKGGALLLSSVVYDIPLWFIEGSAEYYSRIWDKETDMYMRDAIINDVIVDLKTLSYYYGGYVIYKEGQSVLKYIAETYGNKKIPEIYKSIKKTKSFYKALKEVLGIDIETLNKEWKYSLKKRYFPLISNRDDIPANSKSLLGKSLKTSPYNVSPSISPNGNYVAYISEKDGFFDIYLLSIYKPEKKKKILPRTFTRHYESFHLKQGKLNWSRDSKWLLFSARNNNNERIYIYDINKNKEYMHFDIKCDGLFSPYINRKKTEIVFSMMKNGKTDIVIYNLKNKTMSNITNDIYDDINPQFVNDTLIIFSSTRPDNEIWNYNKYRLFLYNTKTLKINEIKGNYKSIETFSLYNDSMIVFSTYINDISNIYNLNIYTGEIKQLTNILTGVFNPTFSSNEKQIVCQFFKENKMDIIVIKNPLKYAKNVNYSSEYNDYIEIFYPFTDSNMPDYNPGINISLDWAAGAFAYTPGYGMVGYIDLGISDIMGDNRFYLQMEKLSMNGSGYIIAQYWLMKYRMDFALLYMDLQYETWYNYYVSLTEKYRGFGVLMSYPFNRYVRIDFETDIYDYSSDINYYSENYLYVRTEPYDNAIFSINTIALIRDNSIWGYYGPINGDRERIDIGFVTDSFPEIYNYLYGFSNIDLRKYFVLTPRSQIAIKFAGTTYFGPITKYAYIGGANTLRGYEDYAFYGRHAYYANFELRFPLIDKIQFAAQMFNLFNIRGVLFTDMGIAKDDINDIHVFVDDMMLDDLKLGFGAGIRMNIWITLLKLDVAKNSDLTTISPETYWHLDFGAEF